jgi:hypothetical protein
VKERLGRKEFKNEKKDIHSIKFFNSAILSKPGFIRLP